MKTKKSLALILFTAMILSGVSVSHGNTAGAATKKHPMGLF